MKSKYKVYISGPITNNSNYIEDFKKAELDVANYFSHSKKNQLKIINPTNLYHHVEYDVDYTYKNLEHKDYMRTDIRELLNCNAIWLIGDWYNSKGCLTEVHVAQSLCLDFYNNGCSINSRFIRFDLKLLTTDERHKSLDEERGL